MEITKKEEEKKVQLCQYCYEEIEKPHEAGIWVNGRLVHRVFCSPECASYSQMSAEG